ncbi:MAG: DUF222 domain-containing protein [Candidatus Dormibacteraeota bacterium]|nr:DUF222 domain-containing protein [Candidatus Dormibacteraeota bacterium]
MCSAVLEPPQAATAEDVLALARRLPDQPVDPRRELSGELLSLRRSIDLLELRFAQVSGVFAGQPQFEDSCGESPSAWLRHECHLTGYAATSALAVGAEVEQLPRSRAALTAGEIGFGHLALIARTSQTVRESLEAQGVACAGSPVLDEQPILAQARRHTVNRFRRDCSHLRHALDPGGALAEHNALSASRFLELRPRDDGCLELEGWLDPEGGAALRTALAPWSRRSGTDDLRPLARRQGDALVEFLLRGLDAGVLPAHGGQRPHLQVTASLATLTGRAGSSAGELELGGPVPVATVQRLACDAAVSRILLGPDSVITDVGRSLRVPGPAVRRALRSRDQGCVWPGCDRPAPFTDAHHLVHWAHGGTTDLGNLVLLCFRHHRAAHEGGWQIARTADGAMVTMPPAESFGPWSLAVDPGPYP